ncbi:MAG: hypothetical protein VW448_06525, partial [Gammaproteobacteria bacterium]
MSRIANMEDPADIKRALGNLIGMTKARNYELGFGGYASMVKNLTNKIDKGFDVEGNLKKLNKITKEAYPELKNKKAYEIIDNKLVPTKFFSFQTTPEDRFRQYFTQLDKTKKGSAVIKKQYGNLENLLATLSNNPACGVFGGKRLNRFTGGGTPDINNCIQGGIDVINSGKIPANKSKEFTQVLKGAGTAGRNLIKFGVIPEALYVGADSLVRLGLGDSFKEAGLRASEYLLPGDQTKIAEISKVERTLGPEAAKIVGRSIDYKNQLQKIESLKKEKQSAETLSPTSEFDYLPSRTEDIKNINTRIKQAESDLQNKFMMPEAERLYAERAQEEAYDISKAKSPFAKIKKFASEIEQPKDDPFLSDVTAPEKSQMELNLDMFPNFKNYLKSEQGFKDKFFLNVPDETLLDLGGEKAVNYKRQLEDAYKMENLKNTFGAEQIYGTQGTFGGQPLQKGGRAGYYDGELVEPVEIDQTGYVEKSKQDMHKHYKYYRQMGGKMGKRQFANEFFRQYHSSGGIASGPPPESGPNSQGLQGLLNR